MPNFYAHKGNMSHTCDQGYVTYMSQYAMHCIFACLKPRNVI